MTPPGVVRLSDTLIQRMIQSQAARAAIPALQEALNQQQAGNSQLPGGCAPCRRRQHLNRAVQVAQAALLGASPEAQAVAKAAMGLRPGDQLRVYRREAGGIKPVLI